MNSSSDTSRFILRRVGVAKLFVSLLAVFAAGAVSAAPAFASGKPFVETKPASEVHGTEATLNGVVNPNGAETKYYFEYGLASEKAKYEHKTAEVSAGSGETNLKELQLVKGLMGTTSYRFRVLATNGNGTSEGAEATFTTTVAPPEVTTRTPTSVKETEATLRGFVNPNGAETKYYFEYGTEKGKFTHKTAEESAGSTEEVAVSKVLTGLTASTTYYYRLVATNTGGTTDSTEASFATSAKPTVETKAATGVVGTEATLNGIVNPKGAETKYYFQYGLAAEKRNYEHTTVEVSAGSGTTNVEESTIVFGLTPSTSYRFRIVAKNTNGTISGSEHTFTTTTSVLPEFVLPEGETLPATLEGAFPSVKSSLDNYGNEPQSCSGAKVKGAIASAKALSLTLEFEKCVRKEGLKCKTAGAEAGLELLPGSGGLVYLDKAKKEVGIFLTLNETVKIECEEGEKLELRGTVLIPVTPVNTETTKVNLAAIHSDGKGKQTVETYENEKGEVEKAKLELEAGGGFKAGAIEIAEALDLTANKSLTIEA